MSATIAIKTLNKLQHLESLYQRGYQSEMIDRSLDKIMALEYAAVQRELTDLQQRLQKFENQYHFSSAEFYAKFQAGTLGDSADFVEWSTFYDMWLGVQTDRAWAEKVSFFCHRQSAGVNWFEFFNGYFAPIYTRYDGLTTQVPVGIDEGLKHACGIYCDELVSIPKSMLTQYLGSLSPAKLLDLNKALQIALGLTE
jgi:hypothetical protein